MRGRTALSTTVPGNMAYKGNYDAFASYSFGDVVYENPLSYVCISVTGSQGFLPSTTPARWSALGGGGGGGGVAAVSAANGSGIDATTVGGIVTLSSNLQVGAGLSLTPSGLNTSLTVDNEWWDAPAGDVIQVNQQRLDDCGEIKSYSTNMVINQDTPARIIDVQHVGQTALQVGPNAPVCSFPNPPTCATQPTTNNQLANKLYVDTVAGSIPIVKDGTEFWVSGNGSDVTGTGSVINPYRTIQYAVTQAELVSGSLNSAIINVSPGLYFENVTFTKGYIAVTSQSTNENLAGPVTIQGAVTVNVSGSDDLFGRQVSLIGITILGYVVDTSTVSHSLGLQNCYIFNQVSPFRCLYQNSTSADARTYLQNCTIQAGANTVSAAIEVALGWLEMDKCDISISANLPCLLMSGSGRLQRTALCSFESSTNNVTPAPLINFNTTAVTNAVGNCTLAYTSATARDPANPNICGIFFDAATPNPPVGSYNLLCAFNLFALAGTTDPQHHAIAETGGNTPVVILFSNGAFPGTAYRVEAGVTHVTCNTVS